MTEITIVDPGHTILEAHKPGCRDITKKHAQYSDPWTLDVVSQMDAYAEYNSDFIAESGWDNQYTIRFMPCCPSLPEWDEASLKMAWENEGTNLPAQVEDANHSPIEETPAETGVTVKRGPKWTYIFVNGEQVMEVRSQFADQVLATVNFL